MKKTLGLLSLIVFLTVFSVCALAQGIPETPIAFGNAYEAVNWNFGDGVNGGGFSGGFSGSDYRATDTLDATGNANASGTGSGVVTQGLNTVTSTATGLTTSGAQANGLLTSVFNVNSNSQQYNWVNLKGVDEFNFASAQNYTQGDSAGSKTGQNEWVGGSVVDKSDGKSTATVTNTETSRKADAETTGSSLSAINFTPDSGSINVGGAGDVNAQSLLSDVGFFGIAAFNGGAGYHGTAGPGVLQMSGDLKVVGTTSTEKTDTSMTSTLNVESRGTVTPGTGN